MTITPQIAQQILATAESSIGHQEGYGWRMFAHREAAVSGRMGLPEGVSVADLDGEKLWTNNADRSLNVEKLEKIAGIGR
ncbi:MAG: hypothetical protein COV36_08030 [Alphaproteobacteria bacterium CG11_big_fil_rev_8_21_14_0_20_44_7]|nr:MAG: hypothetical protein COV36_08030 [Alphaproteobacteria bacterium CG11_big_fil_rev_8_21_14_0_20_44_7]